MSFFYRRNTKIIKMAKNTSNVEKELMQLKQLKALTLFLFAKGRKDTRKNRRKLVNKKPF